MASFYQSRRMRKEAPRSERPPCLNRLIRSAYFLPEKGHSPEPLAFLALGQQEVLASSSNAPRLDLVSFEEAFLPSHLPQQLSDLAELHLDLQAVLQLVLHAGASSAALRLGDVVELVLAQPAIASTRLIPRVLSMNFIPNLLSEKVVVPNTRGSDHGVFWFRDYTTRTPVCPICFIYQGDKYAPSGHLRGVQALQRA